MKPTDKVIAIAKEAKAAGEDFVSNMERLIAPKPDHKLSAQKH